MYEPFVTWTVLNRHVSHDQNLALFADISGTEILALNFGRGHTEPQLPSNSWY